MEKKKKRFRNIYDLHRFPENMIMSKEQDMVDDENIINNKIWY